MCFSCFHSFPVFSPVFIFFFMRSRLALRYCWFGIWLFVLRAKSGDAHMGPNSLPCRRPPNCDEGRGYKTTRFTSGVVCDVIVQFVGTKAAQICPKHRPQVKSQNPQNNKIGRDSVPPRASARPTGAKLLSYVGMRSPAEFGKWSCGECSAGSSPTHHGSTPWAAAPMCAAFLLEGSAIIKHRLQGRRSTSMFSYLRSPYICVCGHEMRWR